MTLPEPNEIPETNQVPCGGTLMKALVVSVNGEKVWSIGADTGSLDVGLMWGFGRKEMLFLTGSGFEDQHHLHWDFVNVRWGDVITIRMTESKELDPPAIRRSMQEIREELRRFPPEVSSMDHEMPPLPAPDCLSEGHLAKNDCIRLRENNC